MWDSSSPVRKTRTRLRVFSDREDSEMCTRYRRKEEIKDQSLVEGGLCEGRTEEVCDEDGIFRSSKEETSQSIEGVSSPSLS